MAAELAAGRPHVSLAELAGELADQQQRLDLLDAAGDSRAAARAVFSWSFRHLNQPAAATFQLAALLPGADFDTYALAALTGSSYQHADRIQQQLARAHLIQPAGPFRYGMHDLLRAYGRELASTPGSDKTGQRAALTRLLDHYQHTAATAIGILFPAHTPSPPPTPPPAGPAPPLADTASARAWLDAELANLVSAASYAADHGWPGHAIGLASTLYYHLDLGGHYPEALSVHAGACRAASSLGDRAAEAEALRNAGVIEVRQGRHQQATEHFDQALTLFRATADRTGQARTLGSLANLAWDNGRYQQASQAHRDVLELFREAGNLAGQAAAHVNLGLVHLRQGRYAQAAGHFQQALTLSQQTGNRSCEGYALRSLGEAEVAQDRYPQATDHLNQALALFRETADRKGEADTLHDFGDLDQRQGRYRRAKEHHTMALSICREMGYSQGQAEALNGLGRALLAMGQPEDALLRHDDARVLADQSADAYQKARAHQGLGDAYAAVGDHNQAREQWRHALAIDTRLGTPEADQTRAQLRILG